MRLRQIKQYGNTWVIKLEPTDMDDFGLVQGEKVDIENLFILHQIKDKKKEVKK